jgi:hypothetical protein
MHAMSSARLGTVRRERLHALLPIVAFALCAACASGGAGSRAEAPALTSNLVVENNSWGPVTLYIATSDQPIRLGAIDGMSRQRFSLEKFHFAADGREVYFIARPLAGSAFRSQGFSFWEGRTTVWTIENVTALSQLVVH